MTLSATYDREGGRQPGVRKVAMNTDAITAVLAKLVVVIVILVAWHVVVANWLPSYLPTPIGVAKSILPTLTSASFVGSMQSSFGSIVVGLTIGATLGTIVGLANGRIGWLRQVTSPYIDGLYALPLLALVPPTTIWLGYTDSTRLAMVILAAFLPCAVGAADGASKLPSSLWNVTQVYGSPKYRRVVDLIIPASLPFVIAGLYVSVGRALIAAVSVEFIASIDGLGTYILLNARSFRQNEAFVGVLVLATFGGSARLLITWVLQKVAPWQEGRAP